MAKGTYKWADRHIVKIGGHFGSGVPQVGCRATPDAIETAETIAKWMKEGKITFLVHDAPGRDPSAQVLAGGDGNADRVAITLICDMTVEGAISQCAHIMDLSAQAAEMRAKNYSD